MTQIDAARDAPRQPGDRSGWPAEPRWTPGRAGPRHLQPWLLDQGSLTAKLVRESRGDFRVSVRRQGLARPRLSERRALGLGAGRWALVREVVLWGEGQPWVFARSVIPLTSLTGRLRQLRRLQTRPLGGFLFAQPDLERGPIELSRMTPRNSSVPASLQGEEALWGRRSIFRLEARPLLVSEVFLPAFTQRLLSMRERSS
ncbi:chorismate--pyruvate lyase family protein [Marinimicrobium sp. C2-29]|uniref:chorismate--pyruvate lyase family protein n=1 Tax=Marinimicrobium sp. C2-29 TaxID=3139825 RepID=UPI00313963F5